MSRSKIVGLAVPLALAVLLAGFVVGLEVQRGPNWRLELDAYLAQNTSPSETVSVESMTRAREPWNFTAGMGMAASADWPWGSITPSFPPKAVRCVLLTRNRESAIGDERESIRQIVFLVYHTDALYRVGWLAYEGPEEPFGEEARADLEAIGCDLGLR
ncbi:MAG: hypothetical protein PVF54_08525 [Anaerolineae bacterium]